MRRISKASLAMISIALASFGVQDQDADTPVGRWYEPEGMRLEVREDGTARLQAVMLGRGGAVEVLYGADASWVRGILLRMEERDELLSLEWRGDRLVMQGERGLSATFSRVQGDEWPAPDENAGRGLAQARMSANERSASACLRSICNAQEVIFAVDADGNGLRDYWTGDVFGLYALSDTGAAGGGTIRVIQDRALAYADVAPLRGEARGTRVYAMEPPETAEPKSGYYYRALRLPGADAQSQVGAGREYAVLAYPAEYGVTGTDSFLVTSEGTVYRRDMGGHPFEEATDEMLRDPTQQGWRPIR